MFLLADVLNVKNKSMILTLQVMMIQKWNMIVTDNKNKMIINI